MRINCKDCGGRGKTGKKKCNTCKGTGRKIGENEEVICDVIVVKDPLKEFHSK